MEKQTGYRFFYDTADLDTTRLDINVQAQPFSAVLQSVFSGTGISFSVDRFRHVFIAKGDAINTGLPPRAFLTRSIRDDWPQSIPSATTWRRSGSATVATIENKLYVIGEKDQCESARQG